MEWIERVCTMCVNFVAELNIRKALSLIQIPLRFSRIKPYMNGKRFSKYRAGDRVIGGCEKQVAIMAHRC